MSSKEDMGWHLNDATIRMLVAFVRSKKQNEQSPFDHNRRLSKIFGNNLRKDNHELKAIETITQKGDLRRLLLLQDGKATIEGCQA